MNIRTILIALIVLAMIAVAYYVVLNREVQQTNIMETGLGEKFFPTLKTENVEKIKLSKEDSEVILAKDEHDTWVVSSFYDYRANKSNIERLLKSLMEMVKEREVSSKPENFSIYEVSEKEGTRIQLFDTFDNMLAELIVGKPVPDDFRSAYVRLLDSNRALVGKSDSNITYVLGVDYITKKITDQNWVDKQITSLDPNDVRKIELITPQSTIVLEKLKEEIEVSPATETAGDTASRKSKVEVKWNWVVTEPENFESTKDSAQGVARALAQIHASDAAEKKALSEYGLDDPDTRVVFQVAKKKKEVPEAEIESVEQPEELQTIEILIGNETGGNKFYCKRGDRDEIYIIMKYTKESIFKKLEDFKPKPKQEEKPAEKTVEFREGTVVTAPEVPSERRAPAPAVPESVGDTETMPLVAPVETEGETVTEPAHDAPPVPMPPVAKPIVPKDE